MRCARLRSLWRRLRPRTMRMRLTLLTAGITVIPLTACAALIGTNVRMTLGEEALRTSSNWLIQGKESERVTPACTKQLQSWCTRPTGEFVDFIVEAKAFPPCSRHAVLDRARGEYRFTVCRENSALVEPRQPSLSLIPWTDPKEAPLMFGGAIHSVVAVGGGPIVTGDHVKVIRSVEVYQARLNTIMWSLTGGVLGLTFLIAACTWLTVGRVLRPVEAIRAEFAELSAHHLDRRVPVPRAGNEIARLAGTMNDTLGRLETSLDQQRQFVADASHELRTPLAALRAELELALNRPENAHWPQVVTDALGDTLRLQRLTSDLLLLARLDANTTTPPNSRGLDLADLVRDEISRRTTPPRITLVSHMPRDPVLVRGSLNLLARVLGNLLDNAQRHTASVITVRLTHDRDSHEAVLDVIDDGPGIPVEDHQRVFERFTRLDDARTRDAGGSGLGLAIAQRIVATHHGTLTLTPTTAGAHFTLCLPTHDSAL
ncbi:HAMP domain-containing sensor histidine kinase [Streptomyces sp. NPDC047461]|uniref:sensor histidine kinase n=1 Tax=Streptomyces sp. NPDC047461 TaxID=3155619 RepID=UPI0033DA2917